MHAHSTNGHAVQALFLHSCCAYLLLALAVFVYAKNAHAHAHSTNGHAVQALFWLALLFFLLYGSAGTVQAALHSNVAAQTHTLETGKAAANSYETVDKCCIHTSGSNTA